MGDLELTSAEAKRLNLYVERGGTLLVSAGQLSEEASTILGLPSAQTLRRASRFRWSWSDTPPAFEPCSQFEFHPIPVESDANSQNADSPGQWHSLATTDSGDCFCAFEDRGLGRVIFLSVRRGLTIANGLHPVCVLLLAHLANRQMPIAVTGEVEWLVNRGQNAWYVALFNPTGQAKPQQGITPTDYRQNKTVIIRARRAMDMVSDWLAADETFTISDDKHSVTLMVPAGAVRIMEIH